MISVNTQEFNYVTANGRTVMRENDDSSKTRFIIDHSRPVTLDRCREILKKVRDFLKDESIIRISIHRSIFSKTPGNELGDFPEKLFMDKRWDFDSEKNSLLIWNEGTPVYANENGVICRDLEALCDTLFD